MILTLSLVLLGFVCALALSQLAKRGASTMRRRCSGCTCLSCTLSQGFDQMLDFTTQAIRQTLHSWRYVVVLASPILSIEEPKAMGHHELPFGGAMGYDASILHSQHNDRLPSYITSPVPPTGHSNTTYLLPTRVVDDPFDYTPFDVAGSTRFSLALASCAPASEPARSATHVAHKSHARRHCTPELARELHWNFIVDPKASDEADNQSEGDLSVDGDSMPGTPVDERSFTLGYFESLAKGAPTSRQSRPSLEL